MGTHQVSFDPTSAQPVDTFDPSSAVPDDGPTTRQVLRTAVQTNPDDAAEAQRLAKRYPAPNDVLLRNLRDVKLQEAVDVADERLGGSPKLAEMMRQSPFIAKQAHDDIAPLAEIEKFFGDVGGSMKAGVFRASRGSAGVFQAGLEFIAPVLDPLESVTSIGGNPLRRLAEGFAMAGAGAGATADAARPKVEGNIANGFFSGVESLTQNLLALPMALLPGGQPAALGMMTATTGGDSYQTAREKGLSMSQALPYAVSQAAIEYATEKLPLGALIGDVKAGTPIFETLVRQMALEIPGEQVATLLQDLNEWAVLNPNKPFSGYLEERPSAAAQTLVATIVGTGGNVAVVKGVEAMVNRGLDSVQEIENAERAGQGLEQALKIAGQSKLRERNPESFQQLVRQMAEQTDGAPQTVFIDAQVLMQSATPEQVAQLLPSTAEQLEAAIASNGMIEVPIAEAMTFLPGTPLEQVFLQNARAAQNSLSMAEAKQAADQAEQFIKTEADRVLAEAQDQGAWQASSEAVKTTLIEQLNTAGRFTPEVNDAYATLVRDFYSVTASRVGLTPEQLYAKYPLRVTGVQPGQSAPMLDQITPEQAMDTNVPVEMPAVPEFSEAVANTPGAQITENGLLLDLVRFQKPEQEGAQAIRTGVFYLPAKSANAKHYRVTPSTKSPNAYGGTEKMEGQTLIRRPLFVKGATGGKAPEAAYDALKGKGAMKKLDSAVMEVVTSRGWMNKMDDGLFEERVKQFLTDNGGQPGLAWEIIQNSKQGNTLRYALQEHVIANAVRAAGYDAVVGYSKGKAGAGFSEVFDVREQTYPARGMDSQVADEFLNQSPTGQPTYETTYTDPQGETYTINLRQEMLGMGADRSLSVIVDARTADGARRAMVNFEVDGNTLAAGNAITAKAFQRKGLAEAIYRAARDAGYDIMPGREQTEDGAKMVARLREKGLINRDRGELNQSVPQTETPAFKAWFGDSKVVDASGKPLVVYHGTNANITEFKSAKKGARDPGFFGKGFYFTPSEDDALNYADSAAEADGAGDPKAIPVYLSLQNPFVWDMEAGDGAKATLYALRAMGIERTFVRGDAAALGNPEERKKFSKGMAAGGYDGVIVRDEDGFREIVAFNPEQIKSATGNDGSFDANDPSILSQGARGTFSPSKMLISLNENADLSTFLHESGHFFLEVTADLASQPSAPAGVVEDMAKVLKWFGVADLATWRAMTLDEQRPYHEKWAESFEQYLLEGKAPNAELQPLFRRFRSWMINVYKSLTQFMRGRDLKVNDEIRQVFDRLIATDEAIAAAEQTAGMLPDFDATNEAIEKLQARSLRDLKWTVNARNKALKKLQAQAKALRKEVEAEVRAEVDAMPEFNAQRALADVRKAAKRQPNDAEMAVVAEGNGYASAQEMLAAIEAIGKKADVVEAMTDQRMLERHGDLVDERALQEAATEAVHNEARARSLATELKTQADALNPRQRRGADAEADAIIAVTSPIDAAGARELVKGKTEKPGGVDPVTWLDDGREYRIGDVPLDLFVDNEDGSNYDGTVNADRASDYASRDPAGAPPVIATQGRTGGKLRIVDGGHRISAARLRGDTTIKAIVRVKTKTASNGRPVTTNALVEAAKQFAANLTARRRIKDLKSAAAQHRAAEARAAKKWAEATSKGDTKAAIEAKRDQLLNNLTAKAMGEAQAEIKKTLEFFAKVTKGSNEKIVERGRDPDVVNAMRAILAAYNVAPRLEKAALEYMEAVQRNDPAMFNALNPSVVAAMQNAKPLPEMTMEELRGLTDELRAMWELAKRSRQMEVDGNLIDIEDAAAELTARMQEIGVPDTIPGEGGAITDAQERGIKLRFFKAILSRVEQWAERLDGKFGGPFLRLVFQPIKDAADRYRTDRVAYRKKFTALLENLKPAMPRGPIPAPELGYTFGNARDSGTAELLHAILHTGNDSNKRKMLLGRGWATENPDGTLDTTRWDAFMKRMHDEGKIAKVHYDFAQGVWDLLEQMKPMAQETHRKVYGRYFAEITANEVVTPFGTYTGGYVPAQTDSRLVKDAKLRELAEGENESMAYAFPSSPNGFTKDRVEYNKPLLLDLRTLAQHMDKVLLFSHMQGAATDVRRLLTQKSVSYALDRIDPSAYEGMLIPWLNRAAKQVVETPVVGDRKLSRFLSAARSRAGMALMFGNLSNTVQQITGFPLAAVKVRPSLMMSATAEFVRGPKALKQNVAEASQYMRDRMLNEVGAMTDAVEQILVDPTLLERGQAWTQRHAYFLQAAIDNTMSPIIWTAAYNQAIEQKMSERDAARFADGTIRQTQGTTLPEDISRFESGPAYGRVFTQFIGYFNMMANTNATAVKQIVDEMGVRKGAGKITYVALAGLLAPIWVAEAIAIAFRGGPEDGDDDGYLDDWLAAVFGMGTLRGLVAQVPIVGQAAQLVVNRFNTNPADDKFSLSPAVSMIESTVSAPASVYKAIVDDGNKVKAARDVAAAATMITGLPIYGAARPLFYAVGIADDKIEPTGPVDAVRGFVTGTASPDSKQ